MRLFYICHKYQEKNFTFQKIKKLILKKKFYSIIILIRLRLLILNVSLYINSNKQKIFGSNLIENIKILKIINFNMFYLNFFFHFFNENEIIFMSKSLFILIFEMVNRYHVYHYHILYLIFLFFLFYLILYLIFP